VIKGRENEEPVELNEGDKELESFFDQLINQAGGELVEMDLDPLRRSLSEGTQKVTGVKLWTALNSDKWRHREAAS